MQITRACPVCGSADESDVLCDALVNEAALGKFAFSSRKLPEYMHHRMVSCPTCDLLYANPAPAPGGLSQAYEDAAFDSSEEAHFAARTYAELLPGIGARIPERRGTLDIGTGDGAFLEELLAAGYRDVAGVEPSRAPIAAARSDVKPLIRQGLFRAGDYQPNSHNLVTCFQTIEHLWDPAPVLKSIHGLLRPGGAVYLVCHNRRSMSARLLGLKSPIFDIEHMQLFSPDSARHLLQRNGFTNVEVWPILNRYPVHYWLKLLPLGSRVKPHVINVARRWPMSRVSVPLPAGNLAVVGYKAAHG